MAGRAETSAFHVRPHQMSFKFYFVLEFSHFDLPIMNFLKLGDLSFQQFCLETYGSIENLIDKAKNGEIIAQADLGCAYVEGLGDLLPKDIDKAIEWLNTAVERGYEIPTILGKLGECLDRKGTTLYQQKAYEMYQRAAKLGCTSSQINLGEMYRCGVQGVVNEDLKEAFKWFKRAAGEDVSYLGVGGLSAAMMKTTDNAFGGILKRRALGLLYKHYLEGDCPEGQPQPTKAVYYLTRAAELGDTEAQLELGHIYLTASCEQVKDVAKARRWLQKASAHGDMRAKQLLEECKQCADTQHTTSKISNEAFVQSCEILKEKLKQRREANFHPLVISQPVPFSEEMLCDFDWSPTARIYLKAFKLVKEGFEILHKSNFTDKRGITFIAHGYLTENSILQAFPVGLVIDVSAVPQIFQLCEKNLEKNPYFFEGLVLSSALQTFEKEISMEGFKVDMKKIMCLDNLIHFIQEAEPDSLPSQEPFKVDGNYSSWLHVLYYFLAAIYSVGNLYTKAAEAYENSLRCCPAYFESKRGLGYTLMLLYISRLPNKSEELAQFVTSSAVKHIHQSMSDRKISKYDSWTTEQLRDTAVKMLNEYLVEAPPCHKSYPNVYYYLAQVSLLEGKRAEFRKYYELGQDAENMRLPFFDHVSLPLKDYMSPVYQLFATIQEPSRCGNRSCIRKVKETELKTCGSCRNQKYCSRECQKADWKNHKATCKALKDHRANVST